MKTTFRYALLWLLLTISTVWAAPEYQLFVDGVLYRTPAVLEKGLPYFPVDVLSQATGVSVVSFSPTAVRLAGSPVDFVPVVRNGRPYLPAEAFALATGSKVETDQTRGLVLYTRAGAGIPATAAVPATVPATAPDSSAAARANPGVQSGETPPEAPVSVPKVPSSPNTAGIQEAVIGALKTAEEATYAERYMRHKLYWASQLDPANSPYLNNIVVPAPSPLVSPWVIPIP
jgi:hypothetical protein